MPKKSQETDYTWKEIVMVKVLEHVNDTSRAEFQLDDMRGHQEHFHALFPGNRHIIAKVRQTLQYLRDDGLIAFLDDRGHYRLNVESPEIEAIDEEGYPIPDALLGPAPVVETKLQRRLRGPVGAIQLKKRYQFLCQVCQSTVRLAPDRLFAEGAHVRPLAYEGERGPQNILILCPNHHVMFDRGGMAVEPESRRLLHKCKDEFPGNAALTVADWHPLADENLDWHLQHVFTT